MYRPSTLALALAAVVAMSPHILRSQADGLSPDARYDDHACSRGVDSPQNGGRAVLERALTEASGLRATFLRGCQQLGSRRWDAAAREFEVAVRTEPNNPVYHFWAGRAHADQAANAALLRQPGLARKTKSDFEKAIALAPNYIAPREALVHFSLRAPTFVGGGTDRARAQVIEILRRDPYRGGFAKATVELRTGDSTAAMQTYRQLIDQFPDSGVPWLQLGAIHVARREHEAAWRLTDQLERRFPVWMPAKFGVGRLAAETGQQLERGEEALRAYVAYQPKAGEPTHALAHYHLGIILERRGDREQAQRAYQQVLVLDPQHRQAKEALARMK